MQNCQFRLVSWLDFEYVKKNILCVQCCGTFALFCRHACFFPQQICFHIAELTPLITKMTLESSNKLKD